MRKNTAYSRVDTERDGSTSIRWEKQTFDETTGVLLFKEYHRTMVPPGGDVERQIEAVAKHLKVMGFPELAKAKDKAEIEEHVKREKPLAAARKMA